MSQPDHAPTGETNAAHAVKMTIVVTVGAIVLILGIILLAKYAIGTHSVGNSAENANTPAAIAQRIAPVTTLAVDASKVPAPAPTPVATMPVTATQKTGATMVAAAIPAAGLAAVPNAASGEGVYKNACVACHGAGIAGAPKVGDKAAWTVRLAQGKPLLYEHAIKGFQGKGGVMPAKGGNAALTDADVKLAVDYMVAASR